MRTAGLTVCISASAAILGIVLWRFTGIGPSPGSLPPQEIQDPDEPAEGRAPIDRERLPAPEPDQELDESEGPAGDTATEVEPEISELERRMQALYPEANARVIYEAHQALLPEVASFHAREVERYVASGMAQPVSEEDAWVSDAVGEDHWWGILYSDDDRTYYKVKIERQYSPDFFEKKDELAWIRKRWEEMSESAHRNGDDDSDD